MVVSVFWLCLPSVCSIASYIQYLIHWPNTFYTPNLSKYGLFKSLSQYGLFQSPGLHTCFRWNLKGGLNKTNVFCAKTVFYTKSCFTQKPCYTQTPCFTQKPCSCRACARAACGLQDGSFHGGRLNTPKAVKYVQKLGQLFTTKSSGWRKTKQGGRKYESFAREGKCWYVAKCFLNIDLIDDNNNYC